VKENFTFIQKIVSDCGSLIALCVVPQVLMVCCKKQQRPQALMKTGFFAQKINRKAKAFFMNTRLHIAYCCVSERGREILLVWIFVAGILFM